MDPPPPSVRSLSAADAEAFVRDVLLSETRTRPVVAITTKGRGGPFLVDPAEVAAALGDRAEVVTVETGDAAWALSARLPKRMDVFGGATRTWWPGLKPTSDPKDHPLLFVWTPADAPEVLRRLVAALGRGDAGFAEKAPLAAAPQRASRAPRENPWTRLAAAYGVGDVVLSRVARIADSYILVELLPNATAIVPIHELDWTRVKHPGDLFRGGETVAVKIMEFAPEERRCNASVKAAYGKPITKEVPAGPGDRDFALGSPAPEPASTGTASAQLQGELDSALEDRDQLMERLRNSNEQVASLRKELRSAEDRLRALEASRAAGVVPTSSETAFLAAVRVEYARRFDEADRARYPLRRMRAGREFLGTLRALDGVEVDKVVEVAAQVAAGRAHELAGRKVHELRSGPGGSSGRTRASDGARAWRCALQVGTPSARRLHWWLVPGLDGATVEFASVALHDDMTIPD